MGQVAAAAINEINTGQAVLTRDVLRTALLFTSNRKIGAAFDGGVITEDHHLAPSHAANARDNTRRWNVVIITLIGRHLREL